MASNRIAMNKSLQLAQRILAVVGQGELFRQQVAELNLLLGPTGYNADASLGTDTGLSTADQTRLQNLVIAANNELNAATAVQINAGAFTSTRQLLDALGTVG